MVIAIIRTLILFTVIVIGLRLMGKRQVGQLQPYELVIIIFLPNIAAIPVENNGVPLLSGLVPIVVLIAAQVIISFTSLKSQRVRQVICGVPSVLIENGKIVEKEMTRSRYDINDLLEQVRAKNYPNIADIEFAILETNGHLSVIPKSQKRPVTPADLNLPTTYEGMPVALIIDGAVLQKNLDKVNLNQEWLRSELKKFNIGSFKDVLFASLDTEGKLLFQVKLKTQVK